MRAHSESVNPEYAIEDARVVARFRIEESYPYLNGHFPGNPLVPGFVQIDWALQAIERRAKQPINAYSISRFKFLAPIVPRAEVAVRVEANGKTYRVTIESNGEVASKGVIVET